MDYVESDLMRREVAALEQISESLKGINIALNSFALSGMKPPHIYVQKDFKEVDTNEERA